MCKFGIEKSEGYSGSSSEDTFSDYNISISFFFLNHLSIIQDYLLNSFYSICESPWLTNTLEQIRLKLVQSFEDIVRIQTVFTLYNAPACGLLILSS